MSSPTTFIVFGATGDLAAKKVIPALFYLFEKGKLPAGFNIVGVSRKAMEQSEFRERMGSIIRKYSRGNVDQRALDRFVDLFTFSAVQFDEESGYQELASALDTKDRSQGKTNRLLYLALPPKTLPSIFTHSGFQNIVRQGVVGGLLSRVIVEKPFGVDAESAEVLEKSLTTCFTEEQIYRVDHYLAKDILQSVTDFRFDNNLLEHEWNSDSIESIRVRLWETLGVESRGEFYDHTGAFRDVGQSHMLEMLALITMEKPDSYGAKDLRLKRLEILRALKTPASDTATRSTFRAQHTGYRSIAGIDPESTTETYFSLRTEIDTPRWKGVPMYLEAGKRMHEARKEIVISFKAPYKNKVVFRLEPEEEIVIDFITKKPGVLESGIEKRAFTFKLYETPSRTQYIAEYAKMILDAIDGDQKLFVSADEVRATWKFTDAVRALWKNNLVPLASYAPDTDEAVVQANAIILK
ncbi:glucose-6-phosphate dehydrogenase (NADP(+)) [Patescibacteria group bacterium]|nr:MAG: glucose-6-phosphate dehydrogenase (NADP(+)) [Patescibacteria group bacterium]